MTIKDAGVKDRLINTIWQWTFQPLPQQFHCLSPESFMLDTIVSTEACVSLHSSFAFKRNFAALNRRPPSWSTMLGCWQVSSCKGLSDMVSKFQHYLREDLLLDSGAIHLYAFDTHETWMIRNSCKFLDTTWYRTEYAILDRSDDYNLYDGGQQRNFFQQNDHISCKRTSSALFKFDNVRAYL